MEAALISALGRTTLGSTKVTIGRSHDNTLIVSDAKASSHHGEIRPEGAYYSLVDLGSTNGTFVNEQRLESGIAHVLQSGDTIRIGDTQFTFEMSNAPQVDAMMREVPPPPLSPVPPGFAGNTSYGMGNANYGVANYQGTVPAQSPYAQSPYVSETQLPTYISPGSGQNVQQPPYAPQQASLPEYIPPPPFAGQDAQLPQYPPQQPPPAPKPPTSLLRTIILAAIALVIVLAAVGSFFVYQNNQARQREVNATATANAQVQATQIAAAAATAAATSHYPPFTTLALNDKLMSSSDPQWFSSSACKASSSGYQVSVDQAASYQWCSRQSSSYSNFAFQANMTIQNGDCGGLAFGIIDTNNFYMLLVCADGTYDLGVDQNGKISWAYNISQRNSTTSIHKGAGQQNLIAIVVQGNTANLYINDSKTKVDVFTNTTNFSQGSIGVVANDFTNPTSVVYTNALVWTQ